MKKVCIICDSNKFQIKSDRFCSQKCIHHYGSIKVAENKIKCEICERFFTKANYKRHLKTHEVKYYHYFCENCGKETFEKYGSCRFCSSKCARGFSTKEKRKEINERVKNKLTGFKFIKIKNVKGEKIKRRKVKVKEKEKNCPICGENFKTLRNNKTCSKECGGKMPHKKIKDSSNMGGCRPGGGYSKQLPYINWLGESMKLNKEEIEVAKVLDEKKLNWKRNWTGFPYTTLDGKKRNFYPDFVVDEDKYIEYKGWVIPAMEHKMKNAVETNGLDLTIIVGENKRYKKFGLTLKQFENGILLDRI